MKKCCYPNCFECKLDDCIKETIDYYEIRFQDSYDKELKVIEPEIKNRRISQKKYEKTQKGKERKAKYFSSENGKDAQRKYFQSQKGKDAQKRYYEKKKRLKQA